MKRKNLTTILDSKSLISYVKGYEYDYLRTEESNIEILAKEINKIISSTEDIKEITLDNQYDNVRFQWFPWQLKSAL